MAKFTVSIAFDSEFEMLNFMNEFGSSVLKRETETSEPESEPAPMPVMPRGAKGRAAKPAQTSAPNVPVREPEPEPEPVAPKASSKALPELDALKSMVTSAVRAAQKSEGPRTILDLLPGFKKATGLDFVMNATEEHRAALAHLVESAGLEIA